MSRMMNDVMTRPRVRPLPKVEIKNTKRSVEFRFKFPKLKPRPARVILAGAIFLGVVAPIAAEVWNNGRYIISPVGQKLLGEANQNLAAKVKFDDKARVFNFNADGKKDFEGTGTHQQVGGGDKTSLNAYSADLPEDATKGIKVYDNANQLSMTFTPLFKTYDGRLKDGRIVYPTDSAAKLIYTLKASGLKEDVLLTQPAGDSVTFKYRLDLPENLEARQLGDGIGIYSADPRLGNISAATDADKQAVASLQQKSAKDHLAFVLAAPKLTGSRQAETQAQLKMKLDNGVITLTASRLNGLAYPLSIDPSVLVTSANDFGNGNNEDNIDFTVSGQIGRPAISGGGVYSSGWSSAGTLPAVTYAAPLLQYNGYAYEITPQGGTGRDIYYAPITNPATGAIGTFAATTSMLSTQYDPAAVIYNGYIYVIGGGSGVLNPPGQTTVEYAKIKSDGTVGTWQTTSSMNDQRYFNTAVAYNGRIYTMGGCSTTVGTACSAAGYLNTSEYAVVKPDGSLGAWTRATNTFTTAREIFSAVVYNNQIYITGGLASGSVLGDVQTTTIQADGSLGTWSNLTSLPQTEQGVQALAADGYIYVLGGTANSTYYNTVFYAAIKSDGTIGSWLQTTAFGTARQLASGFIYQNRIYYGGGCATGGCGGGNTNWLADIQTAKIDSAGMLGSTASSGGSLTLSAALPVAMRDFGATVDDGMLYIAGGETGSATANSHVYHTKLGADGTFTSPGGSCTIVSTVWCDDGAYTSGLDVGRKGLTLVADNRCLMIIGGQDGTTVKNDILVRPISYTNNNSNGQLGGTGWTSVTNSFNGLSGTGRVYHAATVFNGKLYIVGGSTTGTDANNTIFIGTWTDNCSASAFSGWSSTAMSTARAWPKAFVSNKRLMVAGGNSGTGGTTPLQNSEAFNISDNGSLAATTNWQIFTPRTGFGLATWGGYVYVSGGRDSGTCNNCDSTEFAKIGDGSFPANGSPTWTQLVGVPALSADGGGISTQQSVAYNGYFYNLGGCKNGAPGSTCSSYSSSIYYAYINNGGSPANSTITNSGVTMAVAHDGGNDNGQINKNTGYMYVAGGCANTAGGTNNQCNLVTNRVDYVKINSDGTLADMGAASGCDAGTNTWCHNSAYDLPACEGGDSVVIQNNYIYAFSGYDFNGCGSGGTSTPTLNNLNNVYYSRLNSDGSLSNPGGCTLAGSSTVWCNAQTNGVAAGGRGGGWGYDGYLYQNNGGSWFYIQQNAATGALQTPSTCTASNSLWCSTTGMTCANGNTTVYNGYLYEVGGYCNGAQPMVAYAPINSDGSLGSFTLTTAMPRTGTGGSAWVYNGYLYSMGGFETGLGTCWVDILAAPIMTDGSVGQWQSQPVRDNSTFAWYGQAQMYNGRLYKAGTGCGSPVTFSNAAKIATFNTQPRVAHYSRLMDTDLDVTPTKFLVRGSGPLADPAVSITYQTSQSATNTFGVATTILSYALNSLTGVNTLDGSSLITTYSRYYWYRLTIDDSTVGDGGFPDNGGTAITDLEMWYHPNAAKRLRGGKTFTGGNQQSLDASP